VTCTIIIDWAIFAADKNEGMGACLRNTTCHFIGTMADFCNAAMTTEEGESRGLLHALEWIVC